MIYKIGIACSFKSSPSTLIGMVSSSFLLLLYVAAADKTSEILIVPSEQSIFHANSGVLKGTDVSGQTKPKRCC